MKKKCTKCKQEKLLQEFGSRKASKDNLNSSCKECQRTTFRNLYKTSSKRRESVRNVDNRFKGELRDIVTKYKEKHGCKDCGISNPIVLDFDHLGDKKFNIGDIKNLGFSKERLLKEIQKCEVVCSNCHRIRTHNRKSSK